MPGIAVTDSGRRTSAAAGVCPPEPPAPARSGPAAPTEEDPRRPRQSGSALDGGRSRAHQEPLGAPPSVSDRLGSSRWPPAPQNATSRVLSGARGTRHPTWYRPLRSLEAGDQSARSRAQAGRGPGGAWFAVPRKRTEQRAITELLWHQFSRMPESSVPIRAHEHLLRTSSVPTSSRPLRRTNRTAAADGHRPWHGGLQVVLRPFAQGHPQPFSAMSSRSSARRSMTATAYLF